MKKTKKEFLILTINPGSTSTKIGVFKNEEMILESTVRHSIKHLEEFTNIWDQYSFRKEEIIQTVEKNNIKLSDLDAVVGRGGLIKPIPSGTYYIDEEMIEDARKGYQGHHASNLGCVIAYSIGWEYGIPSFIVDPPAVDDLEPLARVSGFNGIERSSLMHALNVFATSRIFAKDIGRKFEDLNLIVAHLGGGITVSAVREGKAINVNNGIDEGPFTPERSGSLPLNKFMKLCLSGKYTEAELKKYVAGKGGLVSYFNTNKAHEVENMAKSGSEKFRLVFEAMAYQIAEEIGKRATNLKGKVDAIIITGGIAHSDMLCEWITERVNFIAKVYRYPGELELEALAYGALRILRGEETAKSYSKKTKKVGVYYWDNLEVFVSAINYIEDRFREKGFNFRKEDSDLMIEYANCKSDEERARSFMQKFSESNFDLVFAIGSQASVRAAQYMKESSIPVICTGIYRPDVLADIDWENGTNFYANPYSLTVQEQMENVIFKLHPGIKKLGMTYHIGELQSDTQHDEMKAFCAKHNIQLASFDVQGYDDFTKAAKFFEEEQVEWVFLGSDTITALASEKQLEAITTKFPTLCNFDNIITHGGMIGYMASWKSICNQAVDLGVKLFNDVKVPERVQQPSDKHILVNRGTAEKFGLTEKINSLSNVKFI